MAPSTRIFSLIVRIITFGKRQKKKNEGRVEGRNEICVLLIVDIFNVKSSVLSSHFITQPKCHQAKLSENCIQGWNYHGNQIKNLFPCWEFSSLNNTLFLPFWKIRWKVILELCMTMKRFKLLLGLLFLELKKKY